MISPRRCNGTTRCRAALQFLNHLSYSRNRRAWQLARELTELHRAVTVCACRSPAQVPGDLLTKGGRN